MKLRIEMFLCKNIKNSPQLQNIVDSYHAFWCGLEYIDSTLPTSKLFAQLCKCVLHV